MIVTWTSPAPAPGDRSWPSQRAVIAWAIGCGNRTAGILRAGSVGPASTLAASLEISELAPSLKSLVDRAGFSFADFPQRPPAGTRLSAKMRDELLSWIRRFRFQLREIELCLIYEQILSALR